MQEIIANLLTDNMEETLAFYRDVLGFKVINSVPDKEPYDWVDLGKNKGRIMFQTRDSLTEDIDAWKEKDIGATMTLYIIVEEIKQLYENVSKQAEVLVDLKTTFYHMQEFTIKDNNGYVLTFGCPA